MFDERDRFDQFTESARRVLAMAQEEAQRLMHYEIGSEHILLALIREGEGVAARVLRRLNLVSAREMVEELVGRGEPRESLQVNLSAVGKRVIEQAVREARALNHSYIGSEHLLLTLASLPENVAAHVLLEMEINAINVRSMTFQILGLAI